MPPEADFAALKMKHEVRAGALLKNIGNSSSNFESADCLRGKERGIAFVVEQKAKRQL
jgi:hypothetical protein